MSIKPFAKTMHMKKRPKKGPAAPEKPRSFKTADAAKKWAEKLKLKKFKVDSIAGGKKFKVRVRF